MGLIIGVFIALIALIVDTVYTIASSDKDAWFKGLGFLAIILVIFFGLILPCLIRG